ncbi:MAG: hypothetical protein GY754_11465 [bacterium]|nr:hypothetical protein [bacterium]
MNAVKAIQKILDSLTPDDKNKVNDIFINIIHNEFITLDGRISIPKIPAVELDYDLSVDMVRNLAAYIPQFLCGYQLLENRRPAADQHSLHFIKKYPGKHLGFTHMFKIDLKFSGDSSNIIKKGDSDHYPSYNTDRIYYKSRLIPELNPGTSEEPGFTEIRIKEAVQVESDQYFHTFAIFEELNVGEISQDLSSRLGADIFPISLKLYPFIAYDHFTACLNILYPDQSEVQLGVDIFEPVFFFLYSKFKEYTAIVDDETLDNRFYNELKIENGNLFFTEEFMEKLKDYFDRFNLDRDEELILKGWWRFYRRGFCA